MNNNLTLIESSDNVSLVSNLSKALARRLAKTDFAALIVVMLNFRLESCRDVCLNLDEKIKNDKYEIQSFLVKIFSPREERISKRDNTDFIEKCSSILCEAAGSLKSFTLDKIIEKNKKDFLENLTYASRLEEKPLVFDDKLKRLYFYRYFKYEHDCSDYIKTSISLENQDQNTLDEELNLLFDGAQDNPNYQKIAVKQAFLNRVAVISGGPGTGKTTTVTKLLIMLLSHNPNLRLALTAPTGKAAARLKESIDSQKNNPSSEFKNSLDLLLKKNSSPVKTATELLDLIPSETMTIHRLLGVIPHQVKLKFNRENKLPYDVLLIDEVSMLDLALFAHVCAAMPDRSRLILLGDRNQLSSVEAGAVLSEICTFANEKFPLPDKLTNDTKLKTFFIELQKGYRCNEEISSLASLINSRNFLKKYNDIVLKKAETMREYPIIASLFNEKEPVCYSKNKDITFYKDDKYLLPKNNSLSFIVEKSLCDNKDECQSFYAFVNFLKEKTCNGKTGLKYLDVKEAFKHLKKYRILCSNRNGILGQETLNKVISENVYRMIYEENKSPSKTFFVGRVVMITKNNQALRLSNGDVGFCALDENENLRVFFEDSTAPYGYRTVNPLFLNECEDGYAMTIHKSQGSEYHTVALAIAIEKNPVLTKELVYTGITRAREKVLIFSKGYIFKEACSDAIKRTGGLNLRLREEL